MSNPRIFISYAHADSKAANRVADELRKVELQVWLDASSLQPGQNWVAGIDEALEDAGYLLVLLSSASLASPWVQREWTSMLARQLGGKNGGLLIPLRLEDVRLPTLLKPLQYVDLFPDFESGVRNVVGFLLSQTRPAWLVQEVMKARPTLAEAAIAPNLRAPAALLQSRAHAYSAETRKAWQCAIEHEPVADAVLQQMDPRTIRRIALHCVTLQHLQSFCLDTSTDRGSLAGNSLNEQLLSLLELLVREARLEEFIRWLAEEAPRCVRAAVARFFPHVRGP
ncbi:MAG: TIR domain-containing protein [Planctomycetaceae bacterium]|nr:TIR domain-containing protein [Planctomycetaceae bacterium]